MGKVSTIFIFDVNRKPTTSHPSDEELQDAKLLYYYPEYRGVDERRSHCGLIEGLIGMLASFTTNTIDFMRTKLFTTTISEWCPGVYLVVCFKNDGGSDNEMVEYSHHWKNFITKVVLENAKSIFELLNGPFADFLAKLPSYTDGLEKLRVACEEVLTPFIIKSSTNSMHVINSWNASKESQANADCLIEARFLIGGLRQRFEVVKGFLLIYKEQLIDTSLDLNDELLLYMYLLKYQKEIAEHKEFNHTNNTGEGSEVQILETEPGTPLVPQIHIKGKKRHLCVVKQDDIYLLLLLQGEDVFLNVNSIKDYLAELPSGLAAVVNTIKEDPGLSNQKAILLNSLTKTVRSFGYDELDDKALKELQIIHGIQELMNSGSHKIHSAHVRNNGWISAKTSNDRELYRVIDNGNMSLTEVKTTFQEFIGQNLGEVYFF